MRTNPKRKLLFEKIELTVITFYRKPVMEFGQAKLTLTAIKPIPRSKLKIDLNSVVITASSIKKENFFHPEKDSDKEVDETNNHLSQNEIDDIFSIENNVFANINKKFGLASLEIGENSSFYIQNDYCIR